MNNRMGPTTQQTFDSVLGRLRPLVPYTGDPFAPRVVDGTAAPFIVCPRCCERHTSDCSTSIVAGRYVVVEEHESSLMEAVNELFVPVVTVEQHELIGSKIDPFTGHGLIVDVFSRRFDGTAERNRAAKIQARRDAMSWLRSEPEPASKETAAAAVLRVFVDGLRRRPVL